MKKSLHENLALFLEKPSRDALREFLKSNFGENNAADFKAVWPIYSKVARHILAMANHGGWIIVLGVRENDDKTVSTIGLASFQDKADIAKGVRKYLPEAVKFEVLDFAYRGSEYQELNGKLLQVVVVECDDKRLPYLCDADGEGIRRAAAYVRAGTESAEASYEDFQGLIDRRIRTGHSLSDVRTLAEHLAELKALFDAMPTEMSLLRGSLAEAARNHLFSTTLQALIKVKLERIGQIMK